MPEHARRRIPLVLGVLVIIAAVVVFGVTRSRSGAEAVVRPVAVFPLPGTPTAAPQSQITIRGVVPGEAAEREITVVGSSSGTHAGVWKEHSDKRGASFLPETDFTPGETVTVTTPYDIAGQRGHSFRFEIARPVIKTGPPKPEAAGTPDQVSSFASRPDLRPPVLTVDRRSGGRLAPGYLFVAPKGGPGQNGPMIVDDHGQPVWFMPLAGQGQAWNFRVQRYRGRPVLTWWQGVPEAGQGQGDGIIADSHYHRIGRVRAGNGFRVDSHEFELTSRNTALITAFQRVKWDNSPTGGPKNGIAFDWVVQEIDIPTGLVLFEWHSLGHVPLTDSYVKAPPGEHNPYDYFHANSIRYTRDGNLLVSARNTFAVYKIDHRTGRIIWTLGGKHSTFELGDGVQTVWQHDAAQQPDGTISIFDNESAPKLGPASRAVFVRLNVRKKTATLAREYVRRPSVLAGSQGSVQLLPDHHVLVGWGSEPYLTEFDQAGHELLDLRFPDKTHSYRAFRMPWHGHGPGRPAIAVTPTGGDGVRVAASWNGETGIARWAVLAGSSPTALRRVTSAPRSGFETTMSVTTTQPYVAVRAESASGRTLGTSRAVRAGG